MILNDDICVDIMVAIVERTLRDLHYIPTRGGGKSANSRYYDFLDSADFVFDESSRKEPYSFLWLLDKIPAIKDSDDVARRVRAHVIKYWTFPRICDSFYSVDEEKKRTEKRNKRNGEKK